MRISREQLEDGYVIPWWYGKAYESDYDYFTWYYPKPLHLIVSVWMRARHEVNRLRWYLVELSEKPINQAYSDGWNVGKDAGFRAGTEAGIKSIRDDPRELATLLMSDTGLEAMKMIEREYKRD